jgi:hypothetical protein
MDSSVVWLILIALVALSGYWLLNRPKPSRNYTDSDSPPPRIDSYGLPGAASIGAHASGTNCDTGQAGGGDCGSSGN